MKITILKNVANLPSFLETIHNESLKLFVPIKISRAGLAKLCFDGMVPGKKNRGKMQIISHFFMSGTRHESH